MNQAYIISSYFVAGILFLFVFWRKLKDDYLSRQIFTTSLILLFSLFVVGFLALKLIPIFYFWIVFWSLILIGFLLTLWQKLNIYEFYEALIPAIIPLVSLHYFLDAILNNSLFSISFGGFTCLAVIFYKFINTRYKNFGWYKSGKVGFAALTTIGTYFLLRGVVAIVFPFVLSFSGIYEPMLSGVAAFAHFLLIFNLAKKV